MKSLFKRSAILALALVPVLLTGCGKDSGNEDRESSRNSGNTREESNDGSSSVKEQDNTKNYPVIDAADYSNITLDTAKNSQISFSFPADEWVIVLDNPLSIARADLIDSQQVVNINMSLASPYKMKDGWAEDFLAQFQEQIPEMYDASITIDSVEIRLLNGEPAVYTEVVTKITDEMIDMLIDEGVYTEAQIAASGGREALLAIPPTTQIAIYAVKDGYCYACTGTYYEENQKQMVLDTMTIMIDTAAKQ